MGRCKCDRREIEPLPHVDDVARQTGGVPDGLYSHAKTSREGEERIAGLDGVPRGPAKRRTTYPGSGTHVQSRR